MNRPVLALCLILMSASLGACATGGTGLAPPPAPETKLYRIGPPDRLTITVLPDPPISRSVIVRPDGMISIDLVGDIPVAGRSTEEVASDIQQRISRFKRDAVVTVALEASLSTEITMLGEVGSQRTFALTKETRLIEALGLVGGISNNGAKDEVRVIRLIDGKTHIMIANYNAMLAGDLSTNYLLQGGDVIVVPPTGFAAAGYAMQAVLFPIQQLLGFGTSVTTKVVRGGL